jgi:HSP20 family protein
MLWTNYDLYNPWNELRRMKEEPNHFFSEKGNERYHEFPAINLWSNSDDAILTAELPGVEDKDIDLAINGDIFSLKGERKFEEVKEEEGYHRQERFNGKFSRTIKLPFAIDSNAVEAKLKDGILKVTLPRAESEKQKKITINS